MNRNSLPLLAIGACFLVSFCWAQPASKTGNPAPGPSPVRYGPVDKESPHLLHLSATYRVEEIVYDEAGLPTFIRGDLTPPGAPADPVELSYSFFEDNAGLYRMISPRRELRLSQTETDDLNMTHLTFVQYAGDVPVFTGELKVHIGSDGRIRAVNGSYYDNITLNLSPAISPQTAEQRVIADLGTTRDRCEFPAPTTLFVFPYDGVRYLAWRVTVADLEHAGVWWYFVDAHTGQIVQRYTRVYHEQSSRSPAEDVHPEAPWKPTLEDLREWELSPLTDLDAQTVLVEGKVYTRSRGEYTFREVMPVTDFTAHTRQLRTEVEERAKNDWIDASLDLRDPVHLEAVLRAGLEITPMDTPGYYHGRMTKWTTYELSRQGIRCARYPDLPVSQEPRRPVNEELKPESRDHDPFDETLFSQNFEGVFPATGWLVGDNNTTNGLDYWDDLSCRYHNGSWSAWCADEGDMTDCNLYDHYMDAYMITPQINVAYRVNVVLSFWWWMISESNYDYFRVYWSRDGATWYEIAAWTGNYNSWREHTHGFYGFTTLYFKWVFTSDYSVAYEGAYVDDIALTGDWAACGHVGTGTGVMGNAQNHIDTDYSSPNWRLNDLTRRAASTCWHTHPGNLGAANDISTYTHTGLWPNSVGTLLTDADNNWSNPAGVDAHVYACRFYDYLWSTFGRNGFDGGGRSMRSTVAVDELNNNAAYYPDYDRVGYGTVSGAYREPSGSPDIVAHEWGHGLTEFESNLTYSRESGALNESFSDIIGVDFGFTTGLDPDWQMGENFSTTNTPLRDLSNPNAYNQPDCYGGTYWYNQTGCTPSPANDYCGVHTNSGVGNYFFYLLSVGGTRNNVTVNPIGRANAMQVVYRANTVYWGANTNYAAARTGCISAATDLNASWVASTTNAWAAVCVGSPVETDLDCSSPINLTNGVPYNGNTSNGHGHVLNYNCISWDESGLEVVHRIVLSQACNITVTLSNMTVDLDVFLLSSCDDDACVAYGNNMLSYAASAATYYVVVDGYLGVNGTYTLLFCITPAQVTLSSPASGATVCSGLSQNYSWASVYGAADYTIQWDDNASFSSPEETTTASTSISRTLTGSGTWYWRVRANGAGTCADGNWSASRTITLTPVPGQVTLTSPADGATVCSGVTQTYSWNSVTWATDYTIQWDDNSDFSSPIATQTTASTSYNYAMTGSGTRYWRVRANNGCGSGTYSASRTVTLTPVPAQVTLSSPTDGATVCSGLSQRYSWNSVTWATDYTIQWDDNSDFSSPIATQTTANTYYDYTMTGTGTRYWRVRANNACGNGAYSASRSISLTPIPGQATLTSPSDGATQCSGVSYTYSWSAVSAATLYRIQWDDNTSFSSPIEQTTANTTTNQTITGSGTWYWRVRAENVCGNGSYSVTRSLNMIDIPPAPALSNPANGATVCSGISQTYSWAAASWATQYTIQWDDDASFTSPIQQNTANTSIAQSITGTGTWYWRVRASNTCGTGSWSTTRTLTVADIPGGNGLILPPNGQIVCTGVPQLYSWSSAPGATSYTIQWDDNPSFSSPEHEVTSATSIMRILVGTGLWYWRVCPSNVCGAGPWTPAWTINLYSLPGGTTLQGPADGTPVCSGVAQTYVWTPATEAASYHAQWDDQPTFVSPLAEQYPTATSTSQTLTGTGIVYWRVRALNPCGEGSWSSVRTVSVITLPGSLAGLDPCGAIVCSGVSQTYRWNPDPYAESYTVQWDDNEGFASPEEATTATTSIARTLTGSGTWYWRVRANNMCGSSGWSALCTITLVSVPAQVTLVSPPPGAEIASGEPTNYCWSPVPSAVSYTIQWADNTGFVSPVQATTSGTCFMQPLVGSGTWYWRVRAQNNCGTGPWSETRNFVLYSLVPPIIVAWMDGDSLRLAWSRVPFAQSYRIDYCEQVNGVYQPLTTQPDTTHGIVPSPATIRFYRVTAQHL